MKKVNIYVARHCATWLNDEERLQGSRVDYSLSDNGQRQAEKLSVEINSELKGKTFDMVIISPSKRTYETAKTIASYIEPIVDPRILVYDIGTADTIKKADAKTFRGYPLPGIYRKMENPLKYYLRVRSFIKELLTDPKYMEVENILIVTHEDITALFENLVCKVPLLTSLKMGQKNGEYRKYTIENEKQSDDERNL